MSFSNRRRILERLSIIETRAQRAARLLLDSYAAPAPNATTLAPDAPDPEPDAPDPAPDAPAPAQHASSTTATTAPAVPAAPVQVSDQAPLQDSSSIMTSPAPPKISDVTLPELTRDTYASWIMAVRAAARRHEFLDIENGSPSNPTETQKDTLADSSALLVSKISSDILQEMNDVMD